MIRTSQLDSLSGLGAGLFFCGKGRLRALEKNDRFILLQAKQLW